MLKESVLMLLVGWIPKFPGAALRTFLYRGLFARLGTEVRIRPGVNFCGSSSITIGNQTYFNTGSCIDASGLNNQITIGDQVFIDQDVRIQCQGQHHQILIGDRVCLDRGVDIRGTRENCRIEIGEATYIAPYVCLGGPGSIKIGKDCLIASHTGIYANNHQFSDRRRPIREQGVIGKGIVIGDDCWIGSGVTILDGVTIGQGSVIGAGTVVTKEIPPYSVAVGVPARVMSRRDAVQLENWVDSSVEIASVTDIEGVRPLPLPLQEILAEIGKSISSVPDSTDVTSTDVISRPCSQLAPASAPVATKVGSAADAPHTIFPTLFKKLLLLVRQLLDVETVTVLLRDEDNQQLAVKVTVGLEDEITTGVRIPIGRGFAGRIAASSQPIAVDDLSKVEVVSPILRDKGLKSMLGVPLTGKNQVLGVFHVGTSRPRQFTSDETQLLQALAEQMGAILGKVAQPFASSQG
jgi:acetyltransferase-like isoleucine patch superfamily enzyme/putative methionine-R-sulfoxide reductase with GAF domain